MARKRKTKSSESRRQFRQNMGVQILLVVLTLATLILTERREAERDLQRRFDKISGQLDEVNRLVQAAPPEPPPGSGATDEEMRVRLVP